MKRLMRDLGELSGLDIDVASRRPPMADPAESRADLGRVGAAPSLGTMLRGWLGLGDAGDGRCRDAPGATPPTARRAETARPLGH